MKQSNIFVLDKCEITVDKKVTLFPALPYAIIQKINRFIKTLFIIFMNIVDLLNK